MLTEQLARAGGGGSSSGSGGAEGLVGLGYIIAHLIGAWLRRISEKRESLKIPLFTVGWIIAIGLAVFWVLLGSGMGVLIAIGSLIGMPAGLYNWFAKIKQNKFVKSKLSSAAANDQIWDEAALIDHAKKTFLQYQKDWSDANYDSIATYTTPAYAYKSQLLLYILAEMRRRNIMSRVDILEVKLTDISDADDNNQDVFQVGIMARAEDQLISEMSGPDAPPLFTDRGTFVEYWTFQRDGTTWRLAEIDQGTAENAMLNNDLRQFAHDNGFVYSQDMGWLFIPERGQLFGESKFGVSDINNHIAGVYRDTLVQLYSYTQDPVARTKPFIIAQLNVPKQYGTIVVRRKGFMKRAIPSLERVETEWTRFNEKYEVFATSPEQATSFELLNPVFMEKLEALPFEVNIEVVQNIIYLYAPDAAIGTNEFATMLELVHDAFDELKM